MLASLILPPGSHGIAQRSWPPRPGPIAGRNLVEVRRSYWLPLPENVAVSFLQEHVPAGSSPDGTGSGPGWQEVDYSLNAPPAGLERDNMLSATVTAGPRGGTLLRAYADLTWYPPRSAAEYLPPDGYRSVKVTVAPAISSSQARPPAITRVLTSQAVIARLARLLDGMHTAAPWTGTCPVGPPQFRLVFTPVARGHGRTAPVLVSPSGCRGELLTAGGEPQPILEDINGMRLLAFFGPLLGIHRQYW